MNGSWDVWLAFARLECGYVHEGARACGPPGHSCAPGAMALTEEMIFRDGGHFWENGYPQTQSPSSMRWVGGREIPCGEGMLLKIWSQDHGK